MEVKLIPAHIKSHCRRVKTVILNKVNYTLLRVLENYRGILNPITKYPPIPERRELCKIRDGQSAVQM